jgi:hypothetical protein
MGSRTSVDRVDDEEAGWGVEEKVKMGLVLGSIERRVRSPRWWQFDTTLKLTRVATSSLTENTRKHST